MQNETWFTSDTHFGHKNILEYEKDARPFNSVEEMNETLIDNWNKTVSKKDVVFHLGDFCFGGGNIRIADRLNGRKKLVMGNHDTHNRDLYVASFERLYGAFYWRRCILTHIPVHPRNLGGRFWLNIHGHLHSRVVLDEMGIPPQWVPDPNYFNVAVELHDLKPVHESVIMDRLKELDNEVL